MPQPHQILYIPEFLKKTRENNDYLSKALIEERRKFTLLYQEKVKLEKHILQLTKRNMDQKRYVTYLLDVLKQTLAYIKDQTTKVEKKINAKQEEIFGHNCSLFPTLNFMDTSNFNIPSPTRKSFQLQTEEDTFRRSNILKKSVDLKVNKDYSLVSTSINEDLPALTSPSPSPCNTLIEEAIDPLRDRDKGQDDRSFSFPEVSSSSVEMKVNDDQTLIGAVDMELTHVFNPNTWRYGDQNKENNFSAITNKTIPLNSVFEEKSEKRSSNIRTKKSLEKSNRCLSRSFAVEESSASEEILIQDKSATNEKTHNVRPNKDVEERNKDLSNTHIVENTATSLLVMGCRERSPTTNKETCNTGISNILTNNFAEKSMKSFSRTSSVERELITGKGKNDMKSSDITINKSKEKSTKSLSRTSTIERDPTICKEKSDMKSSDITTPKCVEKSIKCLSRTSTLEGEPTTCKGKSDMKSSDITTNKCVEKSIKCLSRTSTLEGEPVTNKEIYSGRSSKCLSKTSTLEEPTTSESVTEITQINTMPLIPSVLIERLKELDNTNNAMNEAMGITVRKNYKKRDVSTNGLEAYKKCKPIQKLNKQMESPANTSTDKCEKSGFTNQKLSYKIPRKRSSIEKRPSRSSRKTPKVCYTEPNLHRKMRRE